MTISKGGKSYTIPSSYKTIEDDFITISIGYKAKQVFNKSEIVTLIAILTKLLYGKNKEEQIRAEAIDECIAKIDTLEQISFGIVETELVKSLLEQLKEQNNDNKLS